MKNSLPLVRSRCETPQSVISPWYFGGLRREVLKKARHLGKGSHTALIWTGDTRQKLLVIVINVISCQLALSRLGDYSIKTTIISWSKTVRIIERNIPGK